MISRIRSSLFAVGYAGLTFVISVLLLAFSWLLPTRWRFYLYSLWCRLVMAWLCLTCGIRSQVNGRQNISGQPVIVMSNHQSTWETIFLYHAFTPICPILKKELLDIPFWGWALRLQQPIAIDRSKPREAGKSLLLQGAQRIRDGLSIMVFPEGTRSRPGKVGRFSRGGAQLAVATQTAVLPVLHNAGACWPAGSSTKRPGVIQVIIGEPIDPVGKTAKDIMAEYEAWVASHKNALGLD